MASTPVTLISGPHFLKDFQQITATRNHYSLKTKNLKTSQENLSQDNRWRKMRIKYGFLDRSYFTMMKSIS